MYENNYNNQNMKLAKEHNNIIPTPQTKKNNEQATK